jgi:glucose-1-phosphate cytidylyltransferase
MRYYGQFGHEDFVLCLRYKANVIKEFFLNYKPQIYANCVLSGFGDNVEILDDPQQDRRIAMIDTGIWRNIANGCGPSASTSRARRCSLPTTATASAT